MNLKTLGTFAAGVALTAAASTAIVVPRLEALGDFAEAHNYPTEYIQNPHGDGWTKDFIRNRDGKHMVFALFPREALVPSLKLEFSREGQTHPITLMGPQVGWVPSDHDSIGYHLSAAVVDSLAQTTWHSVMVGSIVFDADGFCVSRVRPGGL